MSGLRFQNRKSRVVRMRIHPRADFREILRILEDLEMPAFVRSADNVKFALLELLNNSLRAHREKKVDREIVLSFKNLSERLSINLVDFGGGFDPRKLPYDLNSDVRTIDPMARQFQEYQIKNGYQRFGMGLLVAKKTFSRFELSFFDHQGQPIPWSPGKVEGTLIAAILEGSIHG